MALEVMMVKPDEFNNLVQCYKGQISDSALLNKAGRVAAEAHVLLANEKVPSRVTNAKVKELLRQRRRLTKRLREIPGVPSVRGPPPDEEEEAALTTGTMENLLKQIVKSISKQQPTVKEEQVTAAATKREKTNSIRKQTPSTSKLDSKKLDAFVQELEEAAGKPKKRRIPTQKKLSEEVKTAREKLLDDIRETAKKELKPTRKRPTEAERLQPLPGWEDWAHGRRPRRRLEYDEE